MIKLDWEILTNLLTLNLSKEPFLKETIEFPLASKTEFSLGRDKTPEKVK